MNGDIHERIRAMRVDYDRHVLLESQAPSEPLPLFEDWFEQAVSHRLPEPNAMVLSTADAGGRPSCRMVLLKDFGPEGFTFFTNYQSRKGRDLTANPRACLLFFWHALQRQISIEGSVQKVDDLDSDVYFHSRVTDARISTWASLQSSVVESREDLKTRFDAARERFEGKKIPRPDYWGGFRVVPEVFQFWQGRPNRMHDRLRYRLTAGAWLRERLAP